ncbi:MAG TPA: iron-containing alcohol dehydrogenase [Ramlibacter sp.]|nr:iron-containing alcohol dehydrogenase [Ramlibacter sp.]
MALIQYMTRVQFDHGARLLLRDELDLLGVRKPLFVTDAGVIGAGLLGQVLEGLRGLPHAVFDGTPANPTAAAAVQAHARYAQEGCDGLVAVGGGSSIDLGKAVSVLVHHPAPLEQYAYYRTGLAQLPHATAPLVAVPTTAGTGSEVGFGSVLVFESHRKGTIASHKLLARAALCDPDLTLGLPPRLTAATGLDALSHCVEAFCSPRVNPVAEAIALDGLARAVRWLPRAVGDGTQREARWNMMMAALQGGLCFQKGLGSVHALSHPLGAFGHHHGTLNSIFLPHVLRHNEPVLADKLERLRQACGLSAGSDLPDFFAAFARDLGIPTRLSEIGVTPQQLRELPAQAMEDGTNATNPATMTAGDYRRLYEAAL